jgi:hypothetical protein
VLLSRTSFLEQLADRDYINFGNIGLDWASITKECEECVAQHPGYWVSLVTDDYDAWDESGNAYWQSMQQYANWGYTHNNTRSWETTSIKPRLIMAWEKELDLHVPLDHLISRPTLQTPGNIMPWHQDKFYFWKREHTDNEFVIRFLVFHEDWKLGHMLQAGNSIISHWKAGDIICWHPDRWHLSVNAGSVNKWTTNITGLLKKEFVVNETIFSST